MLRQTRQTEGGSIEGQGQLRWLRLVGVVVIAFALGLLMQAVLSLAAPTAAKASSMTQSSIQHDGEGDDNDDNFTSIHGILNDRPEERNGTWVISDTEYTVTADTILEGPLQEGSCVEVKVKNDAPGIAVKIENDDSSDCVGDDNDDNDDHHSNITKTVGILQQRQLRAGVWIVDGKSFTVTLDTVIEEHHGGLPVGACVEVTALVSDPTTAIKIESEERSDCEDDHDGDDHDGDDHDGDDHDGDDHDGDDHGDHRIVSIGILNGRPADKVGQWSIGDNIYTATEHTILDPDHGRLIPGVCAKVTVAVSHPTIALLIESERSYICRHDDDDLARGTLFGLVQELPDDLHNGIWQIGGFAFVVSSTTELIDHGMEFTTGVTVKVDFVTNISDTNFAKRIEIKFGLNNPCLADFRNAAAAGDRHEGEDHEHDFGRCPGRQGQAIGAVQQLPAGGLLGNWTIGGVPYLTNAFTKFGPGDYAVGDEVKVEYVVISPTLRFATKIKKLEGSAHDPNESMIVGTVISKPVAFIGDWTIDGAPFVAVTDTIFIEHGSLFAVGAFVVVNYHITNDQRIIDKIVTYIPPGAGDENHTGKIESINPVTSAASVSATPSADEVWTIGGVQYIISDATMVADNGTDLQPGATVSVNSYVDNGQRFATMIREQSGTLFLPMTIK